MENYANSLQYKKYLEQFEYIFDKNYFKDKNEITIDNYYKIVIEEYNHFYNISKNYSKSVSCHQIKLYKHNIVIYENKCVFIPKPFFQ